MELLLLSSSRTPAGYLTEYMPAIREFTTGVRRAVFVPFAAVTIPWDEYTRRVQDAIGFALHGVDELGEADLVIVGGGNTFQLLSECRQRRLLAEIRARIADGKARYLGWSAGANLACPTIRTTNDMPVADPGGLEALGLIPIQINPHYLSVALPNHHGETRNDRLLEFVHANPGLPVIGLPEGDWLRVADGRIELHGAHPAVWFQHGKDPETVRAGTWHWPVASNAAYENQPRDRGPR
jgi:dipeptidase E